MITACVADAYGFDDIIINQFRNMQSVSELILIKTGAVEKEVSFSYPDLSVRIVYNPRSGDYTHAINLHKALDRATNDYVFISDSDVLYPGDAAEFYLSKMEEFDVQFIGASHYYDYQAFGNFPTVISMMTKKSFLPDKSFLKGSLKKRKSLFPYELIDPEFADEAEAIDGIFLAQSPIPEHWNYFPNPNQGSLYDVGCNLWLWCERQGHRWIGLTPLETAAPVIRSVQKGNSADPDNWKLTVSYKNYYFAQTENNFSDSKNLFNTQTILFHKTMSRSLNDFFIVKEAWGL